jgi:transposase
VFAALTDPEGVIAHRPGALERAGLALGDWRDTRARLAQTEARMVDVLDELGLTELVMTIAGLTPVGAAAILAETGDPNRFATPRSLVKHARLCPRDNASGGYQGKTSISGRGRPALRVAAWRAVWAALPNNPVMAAKFTHLTTRFLLCPKFCQSRFRHYGRERRAYLFLLGLWPASDSQPGTGRGRALSRLAEGHPAGAAGP